MILFFSVLSDTQTLSLFSLLHGARCFLFFFQRRFFFLRWARGISFFFLLGWVSFFFFFFFFFLGDLGCFFPLSQTPNPLAFCAVDVRDSFVFLFLGERITFLFLSGLPPTLHEYGDRALPPCDINRYSFLFPFFWQSWAQGSFPPFIPFPGFVVDGQRVIGFPPSFLFSVGLSRLFFPLAVRTAGCFFFPFGGCDGHK